MDGPSEVLVDSLKLSPGIQQCLEELRVRIDASTVQRGDVLVGVALFHGGHLEDLVSQRLFTEDVSVKLVETPVRQLDQTLNNLMGYFVVAGPDSLIDVALEIDFNLGCQLVDLLEGLIVDSLRVQNVSDEAFICSEMDWISILIVLILKESIVSLAVSSCHLNFSDSSTVSHMTDHA